MAWLRAARVEPGGARRRVAAVEATGLGEGWSEGARGRGPVVPLPRPRRAPLRALLRVRALRPARASAPVAEEPAAALHRPRRRGQAPRPRQRARGRRAREPRVRRRRRSATASTSASSSTTAARPARGCQRVDRRARADLHARRLRRARTPAPPRVLGRHARGVPARRRPVPRQRHPHRGGAVQARDRAGLLPLRDRARRQPHRGHDRRLLRVRSRAPDGRLDRGGARARPGLGRADGGELPHLRHPADRREARR